MDESDPQREKLIEAEKIAAKIGQCESDDSTKRAFIMHCLERTIEGFPPGLFSNGRTFVDCIDVEDIPVDIGPASSAASTSSGGFSALFCTLFLFDDRLIIVKRPNGTSSGRALARLDDIQKLLRTNGGLNSLKKSGMLCKGVIDVLDIAATDAGGSDMHLYLEAPPQDQTDRWKGRPFRSYAVVLPPNPINMDPTAAQAAKKRFLDNLWAVQALYKIKSGKCIAMMGEEFEVENKGSKVTRATTFYNLYQRTPYLGEAKKVRNSIIYQRDITDIEPCSPKLLFISTRQDKQMPSLLASWVDRSLSFACSPCRELLFDTLSHVKVPTRMKKNTSSARKVSLACSVRQVCDFSSY